MLDLLDETVGTMALPVTALLIAVLFTRLLDTRRAGGPPQLARCCCLLICP